MVKVEVVVIVADDGVLALALVEEKAKDAGARGREVADHDVARDSLELILLGVYGGLHKNVDGLLKRAPHEGAGVLAINPVPGDGHEVAPRRHDVAEQRQMAVVDVRAAKRDDRAHFDINRVTDGLDAETGKDLADVVAGGPGRIYGLLAHRAHQVRAIRLEEDLGHSVIFSRLRVDVNLVLVLLTLLRDNHVDFGDLLDAGERHVGEQIVFDLPEELVVGDRLVLLCVLSLLDPDPHHQVVDIVVVRGNAVEVVAKVLLDLGVKIVHLDLLRPHDLVVKLDSQQPR